MINQSLFSFLCFLALVGCYDPTLQEPVNTIQMSLQRYQDTKKATILSISVASLVLMVFLFSFLYYKFKSITKINMEFTEQKIEDLLHIDYKEEIQRFCEADFTQYIDYRSGFDFQACFLDSSKEIDFLELERWSDLVNK